MARRSTSRDASDEDDPDDDEEDEDEPRPRRSKPSRDRGRPRPSKGRGPIRRWRKGDEDDEDEVDAALRPTKRPPIFWRARDSLYFEPLVALAIVVLLIVGLYAYTQNWPPVYVVESDSMQHGPNDVLGVINTGDLVLAQKVATSSIIPYVVGLTTGYSTYGEYGDVLLYEPNGVSSTPVIHRAILYLAWNPAGSYDASDLAGLPCGNAPNAVYSTPGTLNGCGTTGLTGTLNLYRIGWNPVNVSIDLSSPMLGDHSGFLTMGDYNFPHGCSGAACVGLPDQEAGISTLVEPGWIVGVARGMIPWVGALKLAFSGGASMVPPQSWQFLGLTIAALILLGLGIHYAFRAEGIEDPRRKAEEEARTREREVDEDEEEEEPPSRSRRFLTALRPWKSRDDEDEEDEAPPPKSRRTGKDQLLKARRGRPRPRVRRSEKPRHRRTEDEQP